MNLLNNKPNKITIAHDNTVEVKCQAKDCGGVIFHSATRIRYASPLATGQPRGTLIPIPTFICAKCGMEFDRSKLA